MGVASSSGNVLLVYRTGHMEITDPGTGRACALGVLAHDATGILVSGSFAGDEKVFALVKMHRGASSQDVAVQLWRVEVLQLMKRCGHLQQSQFAVRAQLRGSR